MAAITIVAPKLASPVGYENVFFAYASEALDAGDLVVINTDAVPSSAFDCVVEVAAAAIAHGIVLKDCAAGGQAEVCYRGEMDGYSGLTAGAALTVASGVIDNTAPANTQVGAAVIRAVNATRIRFDLT